MRNLTLCIAVLTTAFLFGSCNSQKEELVTVHQNNENYLQSFMELKKEAFNEDITPIHTKSGILSADTKALIVCMPVENVSLPIQEIESVQNINDLQSIASKYAASFMIADFSESLEDVILISEAKTSASLASMVIQSKQYLYSLGMTDDDIQQMLQEENADESTLVPFTLALIEHDNSCYYAQVRNDHFSLIPCAYAAVDWKQVGQCSLHAIGADIFFGLGTSLTKTWTKAAIKKAFKVAAEKIVGPVGVAITVVDFALCMGGVEI